MAGISQSVKNYPAERSKELQFTDPFNMLSRLTVVSHEAKKKQYARTLSSLRDHYSELFAWITALNI